mgnify:CR=1 FL=1|jgi:hypothetical protein
MRKYITDTELNEMPKKDIEAIKVVTVIEPEPTPKPQSVVKKVINKKKFKK